MAKRSDPLAEALASYRPYSRPSAIETSDNEIREFCNTVKDRHRNGQLQGVSLTYLYRWLKEKHGERVKFSDRTFRDYVNRL